MLYLAEKLKKLRLEKRLRQNQVAEIIGVSPSVISTYETGLRQPSYDVLLKLANLYRVSLDYLFGRIDKSVLDVSELTDREAAIISLLVAEIAKQRNKNDT